VVRRSTKDPGQKPFSFVIGTGGVIRGVRTVFADMIGTMLTTVWMAGWDEGVLTMKIGEAARIECTPDYGTSGRRAPSTVVGVLADLPHRGSIRGWRLPGVGNHAQQHAHLRD
jgi:hypothetical protein